MHPWQTNVSWSFNLQGLNFPIIVPEEYSSGFSIGTDESVCLAHHPTAHPVSKDSRRFVCGDRFHSSTNPHKSPLCRYHDINLCQQALTIKTSYQESLNNKKNKNRLRSSCMQSMHTHILYNFLMDFYENEKIVLNQQRNLEEETGKTIARDEFMRFVIRDWNYRYASNSYLYVIIYASSLFVVNYKVNCKF